MANTCTAKKVIMKYHNRYSVINIYLQEEFEDIKGVTGSR